MVLGPALHRIADGRGRDSQFLVRAQERMACSLTRAISLRASGAVSSLWFVGRVVGHVRQPRLIRAGHGEPEDPQHVVLAHVEHEVVVRGGGPGVPSGVTAHAKSCAELV